MPCVQGEGIKSMSRDTRTIIGFLLILIGVIGCGWLSWWLCTEGDIIEIIHRAKIALPGWVWLALKVGLSAMFGGLFILLFIILAIIVFSGKER